MTPSKSKRLSEQAVALGMVSPLVGVSALQLTLTAISSSASAQLPGEVQPLLFKYPDFCYRKRVFLLCMETSLIHNP